MKNLYLALLILFFNVCLTNAQSYNAVPMEKYQNELNKKFKFYETFELDFQKIYAGMNTRGTLAEVNLSFGNRKWTLELFEYDLMSPNFLHSVADDNGVTRTHKKLSLRTYKGNVKGIRGGNVSFNIADDFFLAMIQEGGATYYIEPLNGMIKGAAPTEFILYEDMNVIPNNNVQCGFDAKQYLEHVEIDAQNSTRNHCVVADVALACDFSVYQQRGGGSSSWASSILGLVETNYDNDFAHPVQLSLSTVFVATTAASDPWNGINDINTHLTTHRSWANAGGYGGASYALASVWTRKYTSGAVGLAYVGVVCTGSRYSVCSDFSGNNNTNRQLQAHEMGHNWSYGHDAAGSGFIMAPSVNGSNTWSGPSIAAINSHIASRGCLGSCGFVTPPEALFSANTTVGCVPATIRFTDLSSGNPTAWLWTFPGGTPATSTLQNPTVVYNTLGVFDVTLRVSNSGGTNTLTIPQYITIRDKPTTSWTFIPDQLLVEFINSSSGADVYSWKFGDGQTSTDSDPVHQYAKDGFYNVCLKSTNVCGFKELCKRIEVVSEVTAEFSSNVVGGCVPLTVNFINQSSDNSTTFLWTFPGGDPSTSTLKNPTVKYYTKGDYDVTLKSSNSRYNSTSFKAAYISVDTGSVANFSFMNIGSIVDFTNLSLYGENYKWDFGDNTISNLVNPSHTYGAPGTYNVKLISYNGCGSDTFELAVLISGGLTANYRVAKTSGCAPFKVDYENLSSNATSYAWSFPGGTPSTSTEKNPSVIYNSPGSFDVELIASDGTDSKKFSNTKYITVDIPPTSLFSQAINRFTVNFTNESKNGVSYIWDFGDNSTSTEIAPSHTYLAEGDYNVKLAVTNSCGTVIYEKIVAVNLIPKVNFTSDFVKVCAGDTVKFKDLSSIDVLSWNWQFDGGNISSSSLKHPVVIYETPGIYGVKLSVANSNGTNSKTILKYVEVLSSIKCPDRTKNKTRGPQLKKEQTSDRAVNPIQILPNPASDFIYINGLNAEHGNTLVKMYTMNGIQVINQEFNSLIGDNKINVSSLQTGVYFVTVSNNDFSYKQKIIIE